MSNEFEMKVNLWKDFPLSDLVDCLDGARRPIKKEDRENIAGGYPYYGASGIIDFVNDYIFDEELILLGEDGENVVSRNLPLAFKITGRNWVNNHAHVLKPKRNHDIDFLVYKLESRDYTDIISGSAQPKINQQNLMKLIFRVPEHRPEQCQIAKILSTADAVIEKTQATIAKYKAIKQGMLHDLFIRGIDISTGKLRPKYEDAPDLYKESKLGWVPKEWEVEEIGNIVHIKHGYSFEGKYFSNEKSEFILLTPGNFNVDGSLYFQERNTKYYLGEIPAEYIFENGDLLIVMTDLTQDMNILGNVVKLESPLKVLHNQRIGKLELLNDDFDKDYLLFILNTFYSKDNIKKTATGTTVRHTSPNHIYKGIIPTPTIKEQKTIAERITLINRKLLSEQNYLLKLQRIKAGLMNDLLSRRKNVTVKESSEIITS